MKANVLLCTWIISGLFFSSCNPQPAKDKVGCENNSLRHDCLNQTANPLPAPVYSEQAPLTSQKLTRSYPGAPPQIPHSIVGLNINRDSNSCLGCHFPGGGPIPGLPASHLQTAKVVIDHNAKPMVTKVVGFQVLKDAYDPSRYFCVQCHVPQATNLKPLVQNNF